MWLSRNSHGSETRPLLNSLALSCRRRTISVGRIWTWTWRSSRSAIPRSFRWFPVPTPDNSAPTSTATSGATSLRIHRGRSQTSVSTSTSTGRRRWWSRCEARIRSWRRGLMRCGRRGGEQLEVANCDFKPRRRVGRIPEQIGQIGAKPRFAWAGNVISGQRFTGQVVMVLFRHKYSLAFPLGQVRPV